MNNPNIDEVPRYAVFETALGRIEGILLKETDTGYMIKLANGYNIEIAKHKVKSLKLGEMLKLKSKIPQEHAQKSNLPKVLILHTGGTIASKIDYKTGAVNAQFTPNEILSMFPELRDIVHIESRLFRNMMSDDMRYEHYNLMADEIRSELDKDQSLKGIIITHGTDTMHYTSAALSFIFEHLPIPVVLVGSQRSSDRGSSDAAINLICAMEFIANTSLKGVFICMHEDTSDDVCIILNGLNCKKLHSSARGAFKQINALPIARIDHFNKKVSYISEYPQSVLNSPGKLHLKKFDVKIRIGILMSHPSMSTKEFEADYDGLILLGTGLGHFPITEYDEYTKEHVKIKESLAKICKKIPVVMSLQSVYGEVNMNVYSPGRELISLGVIGNHSNLCTETAFIKLAWLLSQKLDPKQYFMQDLRGEFSAKGTDI